jgi:hypothetical protein
MTATVFNRLWFGPSAAPGKIQVDGVAQLMAAEGADRAKVDLTGSTTWIADACCWASDVQRAYIQTREISAPYQLFRVNPVDLSYQVYVAPAGDVYGDGAVATGGYVYITDYYQPDSGHTQITRFPTSWDFSGESQATRYDLGSYGWADVVATDGTYLYVGTGGKYVLKVRLSDMAVVATLYSNFSGAHSYIHAIGVDDTYVYFWQMPKVGKVAKSDLSTGLAYSASLDPRDMGDDMAMTTDHVWLIQETPVSGSIWKIAKSDLSATEIVCGPQLTGDGLTIDPGGAHVWASFCNAAGASVLSRVKVSDSTYQRVWLADLDSYSNEIIFAPDINTVLVVVGVVGGPASVVKLTDLFQDAPCRRPTSEVRRSYWWPLRLYAETTPANWIDVLGAYSDGVNSLGTGVSLKGDTATAYTQPTGTPGTGGDDLTWDNYPTLYSYDGDDVFGWTDAAPKGITGSLANPNVGDFGDFVVLQMTFDATASLGQTASEVITFKYVEG